MRCQLALFSAYRVDQYADPEGFKISLGAILEGFPDGVIKYVCDPRTGLQRRLKWPPTISEVVEACEEHQAYLAKMKAQRTARPLLDKPYEKPRAQPIMVFVAAEHPQYGTLIEWIRTAPHAAWEYYTAPDGRQGLRVAPDVLIGLGMMKKGAA